MKKLLIFDFDGVILDSTKIAEQDLAERDPKYTTEVSKKVLEGNFHEELKKFKELHGYSDMTAEEAAAHRAAYLKKKLDAKLFPGIQEMLQELHQEGYILVLNTSGWQRNVLPLLEKYDLSKRFDFLATAELSKNKVEKFKLIEQRYNQDSKHSLFVTDTLGDLRESEAAGVPTVCVTWGAHEREYFTREPHENLIAVVDDVSELQKAIKSYFSSHAA